LAGGKGTYAHWQISLWIKDLDDGSEELAAIITATIAQNVTVKAFRDLLGSRGPDLATI
jgi:hypothetical protein